jgi:hypothetical protein
MTTRGHAIDVLLGAFSAQIDWCTQLQSPYMVALLERSIVRLRADPDAAAMLTAATDDPHAGLLPLRWAAAFHDLALQRREPWASLVETAVRLGPTKTADFDAAIDTLLLDERLHLAIFLGSAPQTNEVQRSVALLPGLLHIANETGLPLHLLEIGASAGLNLWCDRWFHDHGVWRWGEQDSPLRLQAEWRGPAPPQGALLAVAGRSGCDLAPVDIRQQSHRRRLAAYVWADQKDRLRRLQIALNAAAQWQAAENLLIEQAAAAAFAARELAQPREGRTTVIFHSIVWQYLGAEEKQRLRAVIEAAGTRATAAAPLAWLSFEHPSGAPVPELRCRVWPGGPTRLLGVTHPHGNWVEWMAADTLP